MDGLLSEKLSLLKDELAKIQLESMSRNYSIDLERAFILIESSINSLKYFEERDLSFKS